MLDRGPERLDRLAREVAPGEVDRREREPQRQLRGDVLRGCDRRLRVERVEDRLDQQQVDAALGERADLLGVGLANSLERGAAEAGIVDLRRDRERDVERADRAGDEAACLVRGFPRETGTGDVQLVDHVLERVVGLPDRGRGEGVRGGDVRAGREVGAMDLGDDVGVREVEQVGIAPDVVRVVGEALAAPFLLGDPAALEQHAPGSVEHDDPLVEKVLQPVDPLVPISRSPPIESREPRPGSRGSLGVC